jgi:phage shock protein A
MGILSRMKTALKSKANSTIDRSGDPAKELDRAIAELDATHREAMKELLSFKTTAKRMDQDLARLDEEASTWEQRARVAVKKGNDELAKKCLVEKKRREVQRAEIQRDRDEAEGYAAELNKSRKQAETKLQMLKMRKGTMATQIASARSGGSSVFGKEAELFEKLDKAGERIDEGVIAAEVDAAMAGEELETAERVADLEESSAEAQTDDALAELKARMAAGKRAGKSTT